MKKYNSIEQFRNVIRKVKERHDYQGKDENGNAIYAHTSNYPTLKFRGSSNQRILDLKPSLQTHKFIEYKL